MFFNISKQRFYATLVILGAGILLFRTVMMLAQGALEELILWVSILLIIEMLIDSSCLVSSILWWKENNPKSASLPLKLGAAAAVLHAVRVFIYVLGRVGPWIDFDLKPEYRTVQDTNWFWLYFAATLSILGIVGVVIIWNFRKRTKQRKRIIQD